jgi:hypothetical protein
MLPRPSAGAVQDLIARGGVVLLADALDEVPREAAEAGKQAPRKRLEDLLSRWAHDCSQARMAVAGRLNGHTRLADLDMHEVELLPFTPADIRQAVKAWQLPAEPASWLKRWLDDPAVAGMARVPLLLALACSLAASPDSRQDGLPMSRAALCEKVVWHFLSGGHRTADHGGPGGGRGHPRPRQARRQQRLSRPQRSRERAGWPA